jgi:hypothetical protein
MPRDIRFGKSETSSVAKKRRDQLKEMNSARTLLPNGTVPPASSFSQVTKRTRRASNRTVPSARMMRKAAMTCQKCQSRFRTTQFLANCTASGPSEGTCDLWPGDHIAGTSQTINDDPDEGNHTMTGQSMVGSSERMEGCTDGTAASRSRHAEEGARVECPSSQAYSDSANTLPQEPYSAEDLDQAQALLARWEEIVEGLDKDDAVGR